MAIATINAAFVHRSADGSELRAGVDWTDHNGRSGSTVGGGYTKGREVMLGEHMAALIARAEREGVKIDRRTI